MAWTDGYVSEIDYTSGYYRELSPVHARLALANRAVGTVDISTPTYLELGFGQGLSLTIHAAASPGDFWGTDFNPMQAASAREMVAASGSGAHLVDQSFQELHDRTDLPEFDMIAAHGIWSWVSEAQRRVIVEIVRKKLKPGGVFYMSYNTTPGWSPIFPLRHLLMLHSQRAGSEAAGIVQRLEDAFDFAIKCADTGALHFRSNTVAIERIKKLRDRNRKYLTHEYLNEHWHPMPFSQAVQELEDSKVSFAASAHLLEHVEGIHVSADGQKMLADINDLVLRESVRDYFVNQQFRRDYFVRGPRKLPALMVSEALKPMRVVLTTHPDAIQLDVKGALGKATLQESIYKPLLEALVADDLRPKTFGELEERLSGKGVVFAQIVQAVVVLGGKADAAIAQPEEVVETVRPRTQALNAHLMHRSRSSPDMTHLASPVTGGGIGASRVDQLFLHGMTLGKTSREAMKEHVWEVLSSQGHRMLRDGKRLEERKDNLEELDRLAREFESKRLPIFRVLGIA